MSKGPEDLKNRLENIHSIEPLLAALRTISLSNWRSALSKIAKVKEYLDRLYSLYSQFPQPMDGKCSPFVGEDQLLIAVGSNRGLCGNFNRDILKHLINHDADAPKRPHFLVIGDRLRKMLERRNIPYQSFFPFPNAADLNPYFSQTIFNQINHPHNQSHLLFNLYLGAGQYRTIQSKIFPNIYFHPTDRSIPLEDYLFDTQPEIVRDFLYEHLFRLSFYFALLLSAASENSTRFQLMENASTNAERLADELNIEVQMLRRQKITTEMQELAIGAGLLKRVGTRTYPAGSQNF